MNVFLPPSGNGLLRGGFGIALLWAFFAISASPQRGPANAQRGPADAPFLRYPFEQWAAANSKPQLKWNVRVAPARLSPHQRLIAQVHISVDDDEVRRHHPSAQMIVFVQIEDSDRRRYRISNQTLVSRLRKGDRFAQLNYDVSAFLLPGDYAISLAVCDSRTLEHSFIRHQVHVAEISSDPLPGAWNGMPKVEFLPVTGNPDAWFLPQLHSRIRLPLVTERPVRVELLVNTTSTAPGSVNSFRQNMELVVPSLKVLAGIEPANGSIGLTVIDLARHALSYEQPDLRGVTWNANDWSRLRPAFNELGNVTVDAKTLAGQRRMLDYFAAEAARRAGQDSSGAAGSETGPARALIVLSAPVFFTQQDKGPLPDLPPDPARRLFYIRYSPQAILIPSDDSAASASGIGPNRPGTPRLRVPLYPFADDLER